MSIWSHTLFATVSCSSTCILLLVVEAGQLSLCCMATFVIFLVSLNNTCRLQCPNALYGVVRRPCITGSSSRFAGNALASHILCSVSDIIVQNDCHSKYDVRVYCLHSFRNSFCLFFIELTAYLFSHENVHVTCH